MSNHWDDLATRLDGMYTPEDFETAAYRLIGEQVIYHADRSSRVTYAVIELYEREFTKVLAPLGVALSINRQLRYATAIPRHAKVSTATVAQTLFALVLRGLYDEGVRAGAKRRLDVRMIDLAAARAARQARKDRTEHAAHSGLAAFAAANCV